MFEDNSPSSPYKPIRPTAGAVAVAIGDDKRGEDSQAKIMAAGRGKFAEKILALAFEKGIKVREDADLAEILVQLELDTPIPSEAIVAVAEILAKVYEANAAAAISTERSGAP
ncbi:MAG: EscU/YscU/HrcU family type III secretion system export apparatus switch protein [Alphaproteobacteria bacterium]|nr:EscU/YscU/HrcU family type III secretion system export apparatus switch protein [Alphaproteobacteria bacterium]